MFFHTLSANTTLNKIMVGISLLGEGSILETCKEKRQISHKMGKKPQVFIIKCQFAACHYDQKPYTFFYINVF